VAAVALFATACSSDEDDTGGDDTTDQEQTDDGADDGDDGGDDEEASGDEVAAAECGTTGLVWAHEQTPPDMHLDDPNNNLSITSWIRQSLWEGLYGITSTTEFFPEMLASDMEVVENDDGTVTFNGELREGLTWSDGTAVTAQQVVDTYNIIMEGYDFEAANDDDPETDPGGVYLIGDRTGYDLIRPENIEATSDTEFSFTMDQFFAGYKALFSEIFPTHVVPDAAAANEAFRSFQIDGTTLPSTGPMLFESLEPEVAVELTTNEDYHGSVSPDVENDGVACVTGVTVNVVPDTDAQVNALQAGEADFIFVQPQLQFEEALAQSEDFTVASEAGPVFEHWGLNLYDTHLQDPLVREALALGMNKGEVMEGLYTPLFGDVLPGEGLGNTYWLSNQEPYEDHAGEAGFGQGDASGAIAKLEEAGYSDSGDGVYEHPERGRLTLRVGTTGGNALRELQQEIIQQQLGAAGFEIEIDNVDGSAYFGEVPFSAEALACASGVPDGETTGEGDSAVTSDCDVWDITQFAWVGGPWPGGQSASYRCGSGNNPYGFCNEDFDERSVECDGTVDDAERAACYNELDTYVSTLGPDGDGLFMLPITQKPTFYAYSNDRLAQAPATSDANDAGPLVNVVDFVPAE
jgi:peptide/nickel transport system substrate-binding protein